MVKDAEAASRPADTPPIRRTRADEQPAGTAQELPERTSWPHVWLILAVGMVAAFHVGKGPIALPAIRREFGLGLDAAAWVLSAFPIVGGVAGVGMGLVISRLGTRTAVLASLLLLAVASAAGSWAPGLPSLLLTRVAEGFCVLAVAIAAPALLEGLSAGRDRPTAFAIWSTFMPLGMSAAMMMAPLAATIGWRGLWLVLAGLAVVAAAVAACFVPKAPTPRALTGSSRRDLAETLAATGPRLLTATFVAWGMIWAVVTGFLPTLLIERAGVTLGAAGSLTALVTAAAIPGNLLAGPLLRHGIPRWVLLAGASGVVGLCGLGVFAPHLDPWVAYALCIALSFFGGLIPACVLGGAAVFSPDRRLIAATLGLIMQGSNVGLVLGPAVVGAVVSEFGWGGTRLVILVPALFGLAMALRMRGLERV